MRRFYVELAGEGPRVGDVVDLGDDEGHHLLHVLRAREGAAVELTDGRGHLATGRLLGVGRGGGRGRRVARIEVVDVVVAQDEVVPPLLTVACAVVKGKRFELLLEKAVELGAHRIVPLSCDRGVVEPREGKIERWRGVLVGALKQADRCWLPQLADPATLAAVLAAADGPCYFGAVPAAGRRALAAVEAASLARARRAAGEPAPASLTILVGPEGDWSAAEEAALRAGAVALDLGPHVLRSETAAFAGLVVLQEIRRAWRRDPGTEG